MTDKSADAPSIQRYVNVLLLAGELLEGQTLNLEGQEVPASTVLDALVQRIQTLYANMDAGLDFEEPLGLSATVAYVSPRNNEPAYLEAKKQWAANLSHARLDRVQTQENISQLPPWHRDDMPEAGRSLAAKVGETVEQYAGKQTTLCVVSVPDPDASAKQLLELHGIKTLFDQKVVLLFLTLRNPLPLVEDYWAFPLNPLLAETRAGLTESVFTTLGAVVESDVSFSFLGQIYDEVRDEPVNAWVVQWEMPDYLVMLRLS